MRSLYCLFAIRMKRKVDLLKDLWRTGGRILDEGHKGREFWESKGGKEREGEVSFSNLAHFTSLPPPASPLSLNLLHTFVILTPTLSPPPLSCSFFVLSLPPCFVLSCRLLPPVYRLPPVCHLYKRVFAQLPRYLSYLPLRLKRKIHVCFAVCICS